MTKRIISLIMALLIAFSSVAVVSGARAADSTVEKLNQLAAKFPHGKYWNHTGSEKNNPDKVTDTPCANHSNCDWQENACYCNSFDNAIQCMGYAYKIAYEITGRSARSFGKSTTLKASSLRVGDIIRYRNDGHSICVTGVNGSKISFTDCNWIGKCQIRWGVIDVSEVKKMGFTYVLHLSGNDRKNTDIDFYEDITDEDYEEEPETPHEVWEMNNEGNLNIRYDHSTDSSIIGRISKGSEFEVYDKCIDGGYLWAKVTCGDTMGWCVLAYAQYLEGDIGTPDLTGMQSGYNSGEAFTVKWKEVPGADKYTLYLYNSEKECIKKYTATGTSKKITLSVEGTYYIKVRATSSLASSWKMDGKRVSFTLKVKAEKVTLSKTSLSLVKGGSYSLKATVSPDGATDKSVVYKSGNTKVATVSSSGKITAKGFGTATVTCTSKDNGDAAAKCTVKVVPGKVTGVQQTSASSSRMKVKWSAVSGAEKYQIYKYDSETKAYKLLATTDKTEYEIKGSTNTSVKIKIRATVKVGSENYKGSYSDVVTLITSTATPTVKGTAGKGQVKLTWSKVKGATGYAVYQYTDGKYKKIKTLSADSLTYTKTGPGSGKTYTFKVRAIKKQGSYTAYSGYSAEVKVKAK